MAETQDAPNLAARVTALETLVEELRQELARRNALDGLRADIKALDDRIEGHEDYVRTQFGEVGEALTALNTRLDVMGNVQRDRHQEIMALLTGRSSKEGNGH